MALRRAAPLEQLVADLRDVDYVKDSEKIVLPVCEHLLGSRLCATLGPEIRALSGLLSGLPQMFNPSTPSLLPSSCVTLGEESVGITNASIVSQHGASEVLASTSRPRQLVVLLFRIVSQYWKDRLQSGFETVGSTTQIIVEQDEISLSRAEQELPTAGARAATIRLRILLLRMRLAFLQFCRQSVDITMESLSKLHESLSRYGIYGNVWTAVCKLKQLGGMELLGAALLAYTAYAYATIGTTDPVKSLLGIIPVSAHRASADTLISVRIFRMISVFLSAQALLKAGKAVYSAWNASQERLQPTATAEDIPTPLSSNVVAARARSNAPMCALCLQSRFQPCVTVCGHVGCWQCMLHACFEKPECPICRHPCHPQQLLKLHNLT